VKGKKKKIRKLVFKEIKYKKNPKKLKK